MEKQKSINICENFEVIERILNIFSWSFSIDLDNNIYVPHNSFLNHKKSGKEVGNQKNINCLKPNLKKDSEEMDNILQRWKIHLCGESVSKHTRDSYYSDVKQFLEITKGEINQDSIDIYKAFLNEKYPNKNTRNRKIISVNQLFKWLKLDYWIKEIGWEDTYQHTLKDNDINKLREKAKENIETHLIFLLLFDACLRPESIINLKVSQRKGDTLYNVKTKTGLQDIPMSKGLQKIWDIHLKDRQTPKQKYEDYVFINSHKNPKIKGKNFKHINPIIQRIAKLGKQCNINIRITPYTIRRTRLTLAYEKDSKYFCGNSKKLMKITKHKDESSLKRYIKVTDEDARKYLDEPYETEYKPKLTEYKPENDEDTAYKQGLLFYSPQDINNLSERDNTSFNWSLSVFFSFFESNNSLNLKEGFFWNLNNLV